MDETIVLGDGGHEVAGADAWGMETEGAEAGRSPALPDLEGDFDLGRLSEAQVADLESGNAERIEGAIRVARGRRDVQGGDHALAGGATHGEHALAGGATGPGRISLKAIPDREDRLGLIEVTRKLRDGEAANLREALDMVFGMSVAKGQTAAPVMVAAPEVAEAASTTGAGGDAERGQPRTLEGDRQAVAEAELRVEALMKQREERRAGYDFEEAKALMAEILDAKLDLREARNEAARAVSHVETYVAEEKASQERMEAQYGEWLNNPESPFHEWVEMEIALAEKRKDDIFYYPDWPEKIAGRALQRHQSRNGGGPADPNAGDFHETTPPAPRQRVRMPGSPVGGGANSLALTASAALSEFEKLDPEEQKGVLDRLDRARL